MAQIKGGEADSYYNQVPAGQSNGQYASPPSMQDPPQAANSGDQRDSNPQYQQPPPNYAQNFQNPNSSPVAAGDGKQTFDQVFKLGTLFWIDFVLFGILVWIMRLCLAARKGSPNLDAFETVLISPLHVTRWASFSSSLPLFVWQVMSFLPLLCFLDLSYDWSSSLEKGMLTPKSFIR